MQFIIWLIIAALVALLGKDRKIGYGWSLFFCIILSPLIGLIIILCSKKKNIEFIDVNKENDINKGNDVK